MKIVIKCTHDELEAFLETLWYCGCVSITDKGYVVIEQLKEAIETPPNP